MTENEPTNTPDAAPPAPEATPAEAPSQGDAAAAPEAHAQGGADGEEAAGAAPPAEGGAAATGPEGATKKKRRRRRRKKGPGAPGDGAEAHAEGGEGAEGEQPEGAEGEGQRPPRPNRDHNRDRDRRPQEPRERPAFSVGDVVFGKIVEITDEYLMVDLSGKGRAIFDRHEMTLPDEPAQGPGSEIDDDDDLPPPKPKAKEEGADAAPVAEGEGAAVSAEPSLGDTGEAQSVEVPAAEAATTAEPVVHAPPPPREHEPAVPVVTLPPVVLEMGANFVGVVHNDGGRGGNVVLTRHPRRGRAMKPAVAAALREKTLVTGLVTGAIKGGVEVDIEGLRAFAPASHVSLRMGSDLRALVGKRLQFAVTQYAKRGRDIVLSRKAMLEAEEKTSREEALKRVMVGSTVPGIVRSVVPFGAFIDIGGIEGLVPLTEMSHNRGDTPSDVFTVGETVDVQIQRIDVKGKIWLSRRATLPDPWADVAKKYAEGTRHKGRVARLQPFGAFVELEPGIDGLIHTADLSVKRIEHPSEVVKVGDELDVFVAHVDAGAHKIALHPVPEGAAEGEQLQRVAPHKIVRVAVVQIDAGGLQVRVLGATGRHARGFVTAAATGTPRGTDLRKLFPVGHEFEAKVVEIDPRRGEVKLSVKAMTEQNERDAYRAYKAKVTQEAKFGTLGDLLKKSQEK